MDKRIIKFLGDCTVMTFATSLNGQPYCAHCFYAFDKSRNVLIFLSDDSTRHITEAKENKKVGGTINSESVSVAKLQGIQFTGEFLIPKEVGQKEFYSIYYKKYPFARAKPAPIWAVQLNTIKMTDNTLGFGTKLKWNRFEELGSE